MQASGIHVVTFLLARNGFLKTRDLCEVCRHAEQDTLTSLLAVVHVYEADGVLLFVAISARGGCAGVDVHGRNQDGVLSVM